jgi:hypothetical protein
VRNKANSAGAVWRISAVRTRSCDELDMGAASEKQSQWAAAGGQQSGVEGKSNCAKRTQFSRHRPARTGRLHKQTQFVRPGQDTGLSTSVETPCGVTTNRVVAKTNPKGGSRWENRLCETNPISSVPAPPDIAGWRRVHERSCDTGCQHPAGRVDHRGFGVPRLRGSEYGRMIIRPYLPEGGTGLPNAEFRVWGPTPNGCGRPGKSGQHAVMTCLFPSLVDASILDGHRQPKIVMERNRR